MFAWAEHEKETQTGHVGDSEERVVRGRGLVGGKQDGLDYLNGYGLDTLGRRIGLSIGAQLSLKAEVDFALGV